MLGGLFGRRNSRISRVEGCEVVGWALFIVCQMWGKGDALLNALVNLGTYAGGWSKTFEIM